MANFCENCGSPLKSENKFCPNCGAPIKQTEATAPATATTPNSFPENASANTSPANAPTGNPSTTSAISDTSSAVSGVAGAATAATLGAIHPDPVPEKPQDAFVPPREQTPPDPQPFHEEASKDNGPSHSSLRQEAEQAFPHTDYIHKEEFSRGGTGPKYEPDKDLQSMFLRYDNRLNRKRYFFRALALGAAAMLRTIISIAALIPSFMLIVRRLHDLNRPAWWCVGVFVPLVNLVLGIYLLFFKGTDGPNDYGPDPLEVPGGLL